MSITALVAALVLGWSAYGKLVGADVPIRARRTALSRLLGESRAPVAFRAVGIAELTVAVALLVSPPVGGAAGVALSTGFLAYLAYARVAAPHSSCGCSASAVAPVSWRSFARAGLLLIATLFAATASEPWWTGSGLVGVAFGALFVASSPELDRHWLLPLRRLRVRLTHPLAATAAIPEIPLAATQQQLLRSPAYRALGSFLRSDVMEHWDEGPWRFLRYTAAYGEHPATAVFAVPLHRFEPDDVKGAIVDETTGETLYRPVVQPVLL